MPASENFNAAFLKLPERYKLDVISDHMIRSLQRDNIGNTVQTVTFDFLNRIVSVLPSNDSSGAHIFTFPAFDAGSIEWHYNQLKAAGRNPRAPEGILDKPDAPAKSGGLAL
ncbi:MAG: hypothetical protein ACAH80_04460 [Alphaproteobacteria bacterium]